MRRERKRERERERERGVICLGLRERYGYRAGITWKSILIIDTREHFNGGVRGGEDLKREGEGGMGEGTQTVQFTRMILIDFMAQKS